MTDASEESGQIDIARRLERGAQAERWLRALAVQPDNDDVYHGARAWVAAQDEADARALTTTRNERCSASI
ncbi:MAG: hypothetical protein AB7G23_02890 [Vicinamibacterales bacterium]